MCRPLFRTRLDRRRGCAEPGTNSSVPRNNRYSPCFPCNPFIRGFVFALFGPSDGRDGLTHVATVVKVFPIVTTVASFFESLGALDPPDTDCDGPPRAPAWVRFA